MQLKYRIEFEVFEDDKRAIKPFCHFGTIDESDCESQRHKMSLPMLVANVINSAVMLTCAQFEEWLRDYNTAQNADHEAARKEELDEFTN